LTPGTQEISDISTGQGYKIFIPFPFWIFLSHSHSPNPSPIDLKSHFPRAEAGQFQFTFYPFRTLSHGGMFGLNPLSHLKSPSFDSYFPLKILADSLSFRISNNPLEVNVGFVLDLHII